MDRAIRVRKRVKMKTKTETKAVEPGLPGALGVRPRGKGGFHLEVRTGSRGCRKIHVAHFGHDRELAKMAHDVARRCHLGESAYLALCESRLNFWESRGAVAELFRRDARMVALADAHRMKEEAGKNWDPGMKTTLRELALDALRWIKDRAHEAAEGQPVDSQNIDVGYGDEGPHFDIDGGLGPEDGAAPENWPHMKEALRSITPELPELTLEVQLDVLWNEYGRLEAENKMLKARLHGCNCPETTRL